MKELILLGTASTLAVTPWDKEKYDYWACAPVITHKPASGHRIDRIFEMHPMEYWTKIIERLNQFSKATGCEVYMQHKYDQIEKSVEYPLHMIQDWILKDHPYATLNKYFTSTIAFMLALAIYEAVELKKYSCLKLFGIHMSSEEEEYSRQRSCCEAWLNFGLGKGIDYWLPQEASIMQGGYIYGYEQEKGILLDLMHDKEAFEHGLEENKKLLEKEQKNYWMQEGAIRGMNQLISKYKKG